MSVYATNEYIVSSNNSINENKYNAQKLKSRNLKSFLRPIMKIIKKAKQARAVSQQKTRYDEDCSFECDQNDANERLERDIVEEMENCAPNSAFLVYNGDETCDVVPVTKGSTFVPVHFARTETGTFFWTSVVRTADVDIASSGHCYTECQRAEQQMPFYGHDRWVQA